MARVHAGALLRSVHVSGGARSVELILYLADARCWGVTRTQLGVQSTGCRDGAEPRHSAPLRRVSVAAIGRW